jgi:hypothetical protein
MRNTTEYMADHSRGSINVTWSCKSPGAYRFVITAEDSDGHHRAVSGRFNTISSGRCASMRTAERAAAHARARAERQAEQRAQAQAQAEAQAEYNRFVHNCIAEGGTPVPLQLGTGPATGCRAPWGGLLIVLT